MKGKPMKPILVVLTVLTTAAAVYARDTYLDVIRATKVCARDGSGCVSTPLNGASQYNTSQVCGSSGQQCVNSPLPQTQWGQNAFITGAFDAGLSGFATDGGLVE